MKVITLILFFFIAVGCGTAPSKIDQSVEKPRLTDGEYAKLISEHTKSDEKYNGLQNLYHLHVTILNSKVNGSRLDQIRYYNQLDGAEAAKEREKNFQEMSNSAQFFISYYSPDRDLRKLPKMWKFYLEHNGVKYPGKIKHLSERDFEVRVLYPHFDRWSKGYIIEFPVPMTEVEKFNSEFVMTGSAGTTRFQFDPSL
ncbi:MAG: hypothetical protein R2827_16500 [Bdellovibrionales bacterium]